MEKERKDYREFIKKEANLAGFQLVGFSDLNLSIEEKNDIENFGKENENNGLAWFQKHICFRKEPQKIFPESEGAIVLASYYRDIKAEAVLKKSKARISRYAHGKDYHKVLRKKAKKLVRTLETKITFLKSRICVDSAPIPEKILAKKSGIVWQGKNTNVIHPHIGSYFFLCIILVNLRFEVSQKMIDYCRSCNLCIEACPTSALSYDKPYQLDAKKCISYLTIEKKEEIEELFQDKLEDWIYGCDICQEVCPYNRNRRARHLSTQETSFFLQEQVSDVMQKAKISSQVKWEELSKASPINRIKKEKLLSNLSFIKD